MTPGGRFKFGVSQVLLRGAKSRPLSHVCLTLRVAKGNHSETCAFRTLSGDTGGRLIGSGVSLTQGRGDYSHFTDGETEAQRQWTRQRPHWLWAEAAIWAISSSLGASRSSIVIMSDPDLSLG